MLISKQPLIASSELARPELSHKADIEELKPGWAPLKYFPGRESARLSAVFVACQVSALINVGIEVGVEGWRTRAVGGRGSINQSGPMFSRNSASLACQ